MSAPPLRHYCTLFDLNYLGRGLALYFSLERFAQPFRLHVFAFDDKSAEVLKALRLPHLSVITLQEFETPELLALKPSRSRGEYCWTCTPAVITHCLDRLGLDLCTYLDADLWFYSSPEALFAEMGDASVLIIDHRYTPRYDQSATSGRYCVQFMPFRNDPRGRAVLDWWLARCIEWCYARFEDGKFGDQKYLDDWPQRFPGVHDLRHLGGGLAPWNIARYRLQQPAPGTQAPVITGDGRADPLVFYHFHQLALHTGGGITLTSMYRLSRAARELIYRPYLRALDAAQAAVAAQFPGLDVHGRRPEPELKGGAVRQLRYRYLGKRNYYPPTALWLKKIHPDGQVAPAQDSP